MNPLDEEIKKAIQEIKTSFDKKQELGHEEMEVLFLASLIEERLGNE